jgi:hypothetical protein
MNFERTLFDQTTYPVQNRHLDNLDAIKSRSRLSISSVKTPRLFKVIAFISSQHATHNNTSHFPDSNTSQSNYFLSFHQDGVVRPYNLEEVTGDRVLKSLDGGRFADTDSYVTPEAVDAKKESLIMVIAG